MALTLSGRQIFLASPDGLQLERERLRQTIEIYNRKTAYWNGVTFIARGWEDEPGGFGRAQSQINEIVADCDYTVVILADRWGSSPGGEDYSSGTEEEFMLSLKLRAGANKNLRDVLVLFKSIPDAQMADPGEELSRVLAFKKRLEDSKQILYSTFDSLDSLQEKFEKALNKWGKPWDKRVPMQIDLPPATEEPNTAEIENALVLALECAADGQLVQAELLFARSVQNGDPLALSEFARFLRRQGRLNDSRALNMRVVELYVGRSSLSAEETGLLSDSLANVGVIDRKQGKLADSARTLGESVAVARKAATPLPQHLAYALENLGHTQAQNGETVAAEESFKASEQIRIEVGDNRGRVASVLNLGWHMVRSRHFDEALQHFRRAESLVEEDDDELSLASALAGQGSCHEKLGCAQTAIEPLCRSLEINRRLKATDGIGITAGLLARAYLQLGDTESATLHARETLDANQSSTNHTGLATAYQIFARIERAEQRIVAANKHFDEAIYHAQLSGNINLLRAIEHDYAREVST